MARLSHIFSILVNVRHGAAQSVFLHFVVTNLICCEWYEPNKTKNNIPFDDDWRYRCSSLFPIFRMFRFLNVPQRPTKVHAFAFVH